jgi:GTP cyclohydrolase I
MNFLDPKTEKEKTSKLVQKPSQNEAEEAVRILLRWAGEDPAREGLIDTPRRVVKAYTEWFAGYNEDPEVILSKTFKEVEGYSEAITLKDIRFESYCEHHMAPIIGIAHVSYLPKNRVVGISKIARLVNAYSKRLQVQEKMTAQIAKTLQNILKPHGVAVFVEGEHHCMCTRGVNKNNVNMITSAYTGDYRKNNKLKEEFLSILRK